MDAAGYCAEANAASKDIGRAEPDERDAKIAAAGELKAKVTEREQPLAENTTVALVDAPDDFEKTLGALPEGAKLRKGARSKNDLFIWFTRSRADLDGLIEKMAATIGEASLWIAWPKKASKVASDLTQQIVRETGLATGLVDYKICSIDQTWSALLFTRRKGNQ